MILIPIVPFPDGNGRTGRMILFRESLRHNMVPIIIRNENKAAYVYSLNKAQTAGNIRGLVEYFEQEQNRFFEETKNTVLPFDVIKNDEIRKQARNLTESIQTSNTTDQLEIE